VERRGVHDAVDYDRCRFEPVIARQLDRPARLKLPDVRRVHLFQRRVVPPLIIAPVGEPVLRLGGGLEEAVIGDAAGDFGLNGLREIPSSQRPEIRDQTLDFGLGKTLCEIGRHEGLLLDGCAHEIPLIESQQSAAGVGDEQRKRIFRAPDVTDLLRQKIVDPGSLGRRSTLDEFGDGAILLSRQERFECSAMMRQRITSSGLCGAYSDNR
jgi:hypothetical protein